MSASISTATPDTASASPGQIATQTAGVSPDHDGVTGWGATQAAWLATHQSLNSNNTAFGPDRIDGTNPKYLALTFSGPAGTAGLYDVMFAHPMTEAAAKAASLAEFPSDTRIVASSTGDGTCHVFRVHSAVLDAHFARLGVAAPAPYFELLAKDPTATYSPSAAASADFGFQATSEPLGGC